MKAASIAIFCLAPWLCAAFTAFVGQADLRESIRLTSFLFFMLWPVISGLVVLLLNKDA